MSIPIIIRETGIEGAPMVPAEPRSANSPSTRDQISRFFTSRALSSMNLRRASTSSPISVREDGFALGDVFELSPTAACGARGPWWFPRVAARSFRRDLCSAARCNPCGLPRENVIEQITRVGLFDELRLAASSSRQLLRARLERLSSTFYPHLPQSRLHRRQFQKHPWQSSR